jgi:uncharacterized DUF497 family protein
VELEWDETKRQDTLDERKLDFADVDRFDSASLQTFEDLRFDYGEARYITTGYLDARLVVACWTPRNGRVRIISLRKANDRERKSYEARQNSGNG